MWVVSFKVQQGCHNFFKLHYTFFNEAVYFQYIFFKSKIIKDVIIFEGVSIAAMCGDGANDCGALKVAHAGISLSDAESSVAAPFTSRQPDVDCVIKIIREGRAALVTSLAIFKYMAGYSITQFTSVMILYSIDSNLTDVQYLFVDLFLISVFAFLLGRTEANSGPLVPQLPEMSLISPKPIASLVGQLAIVIVFQLISFFSLSGYDW
jgi:cation-transporting ATPase 13A2